MDNISINLDLQKLSLEEVRCLEKIAVRQLLFDDASRLRYYRNRLIKEKDD